MRFIGRHSLQIGLNHAGYPEWLGQFHDLIRRAAMLAEGFAHRRDGDIGTDLVPEPEAVDDCFGWRGDPDNDTLDTMFADPHRQGLVAESNKAHRRVAVAGKARVAIVTDYPVRVRERLAKRGFHR